MSEFNKWKKIILLVSLLQNILFPIITAYIPTIYINTKINFIFLGLFFSIIFLAGTVIILDDFEGFREKLNNSSLINLPTPEYTEGMFHWLGNITINPLVFYGLIMEFLFCNLAYIIW